MTSTRSAADTGLSRRTFLSHAAPLPLAGVSIAFLIEKADASTNQALYAEISAAARNCETAACDLAAAVATYEANGRPRLHRSLIMDGESWLEFRHCAIEKHKFNGKALKLATDHRGYTFHRHIAEPCQIEAALNRGDLAHNQRRFLKRTLRRAKVYHAAVERAEKAAGLGAFDGILYERKQAFDVLIGRVMEMPARTVDDVRVKAHAFTTYVAMPTETNSFWQAKQWGTRIAADLLSMKREG